MRVLAYDWELQWSSILNYLSGLCQLRVARASPNGLTTVHSLTEHMIEYLQSRMLESPALLTRTSAIQTVVFSDIYPRSTPSSNDVLVPETLLKKRKSQEKECEAKQAEIQKRKQV